MDMSKERQGEIALSVVKRLLAKYGHTIQFKALIDFVANKEAGITASEAGIFLGMSIVLDENNDPEKQEVVRTGQDRRKTNERRRPSSERRKA